MYKLPRIFRMLNIQERNDIGVGEQNNPGMKPAAGRGAGFGLHSEKQAHNNGGTDGCYSRF